MLCGPPVREEMTQVPVAVPFDPERVLPDGLLHANGVAPAAKVTVPVCEGASAGPVKVAVKVTEVP